MNLPTLVPVRADLVKKHLPQAIALTLGRSIPAANQLTKQDKIIITKICSNLNTICKLNMKELKEVIKQEPMYQQALADLYFDKKINNYILITKQQKPLTKTVSPLLEQSQLNHPHTVIDIQYRIEFTVSTIAKKNVMKPVVLLTFTKRNGSKNAIYYDLEQFGQLRQRVSNAMRQVYGVEMRAL